MQKTKEARKKAEKALSDIKNGMPFNKAAATYSAAADALKGGDYHGKH